MSRPNELAELFGRNPQDRASNRDVDDPRAERGTMVPLYTRWMRFLLGDPIGYLSVASTGLANPQTLANIPPDTRALVFYVSGGNIVYRVDGSVPTTAADQTIQEGSTVTLTGRPTISGFVFAGVIGAVTLYGTYYD